MIEALQSLAGRNMLYTHQTEQGAVGYALLQVGCGIPQAFFWGGQEDDGARRMAKLLLKYFSVPTTAAVYSRASTKTYKYSPANVGILRRRKIPRDMLMAVYFIRETDLDECIGCGSCADICPVDAVTMVDERPKVDHNWCIGCGVCAVSCPAEVISLVRRLEVKAPKTFSDLHQKIKQERSLAENGLIYPHKEKNE